MKKIIIILLLSGIAGASGWMAIISFQKIKTKQKIEAGLEKIPEFSFLNMDSVRVSVKNTPGSGPLILIYFNSECSHCKNEADQIVDGQDRLDGIKILFLSTEPLKKIKAFDKQFGLTKVNGLNLGKIDEITAFDVLGITTSPQIYIYNHEGNLKKQFRGTTKTETLSRYANM